MQDSKKIGGKCDDEKGRKTRKYQEAGKLLCSARLSH